ncbi:MAG: hypothetical protein Q9M11_08490 [Mariprofundaceae bacterium]|nr:hypothetical protein [Mariprofundaceae bacterium]
MSSCFTHSFEIRASHPCFEGHFPGFPVFPAVGQLSLLAEVVSLLHGESCVIIAISAAKFFRPIIPDTMIMVELKRKGENNADFAIRCTEGVIAKGKLTYRILGL